MLPMKTGLPARSPRIVPYLTPDEVQRLCSGCRGRQQDRNTLLILVLFQTGLRVSEALALTSGHLSRQPGALEVLGKGGKPRLVACPAALTHRLKAYAVLDAPHGEGFAGVRALFHQKDLLGLDPRPELQVLRQGPVGIRADIHHPGP
jgi:integrase/recombinase XerD